MMLNDVSILRTGLTKHGRRIPEARLTLKEEFIPRDILNESCPGLDECVDCGIDRDIYILNRYKHRDLLGREIMGDKEGYSLLWKKDGAYSTAVMSFSLDGPMTEESAIVFDWFELHGIDIPKKTKSARFYILRNHDAEPTIFRFYVAFDVSDMLSEPNHDFSSWTYVSTTADTPALRMLSRWSRLILRNDLIEALSWDLYLLERSLVWTPIDEVDKALQKKEQEKMGVLF